MSRLSDAIATRRSSLAAWRPGRAPAAAAVIPALAIGFLAWPMLFTSSGMAQDWTHHLWYLWRQSVMIGRSDRPSLFLNDGGSVFYPLYAFYGGTIYAIFGTLASVFGGAPVVAYVASYLLGFTASYSGWYLLARSAGLGRWQAQVPGLLFITSAYYLTLIYARGDWPEFIAISTLPLLAAVVLRTLLADRVELRWAILLVVCAVVFFGSHNLTMLWGATVLAIVASASLVAIPQARRLINRTGVIRVAVLVIPAGLVNAWYLFPALAYGRRTEIAMDFDYAGSLRSTSGLVSASHLFTFSRSSVVGDTPDFVLALPVLVIAWLLLSLILSLSLRGDQVWKRVLWVFAALSVAFTIVMTHSHLILELPDPYTFIQFSYRLETYVLVGISGAVLSVLVLARSWRRPWRAWSWATIVLVLVSAVGAVQQVDNYPRGTGDPGVVEPDRYAVFNPSIQPPFSGGLGDYNDATTPLVEPAGAPIGITFPAAIRDEKVTIPVDLPAGVLVHTNLTGAPYLVNVNGATVVGHDRSGHMVLRIASSSRMPRQITLSRSSRLPVVLGRVVTAGAALVLVLLLVGFVIRRSSVRRRRVAG